MRDPDNEILSDWPHAFQKRSSSAIRRSFISKKIRLNIASPLGEISIVSRTLSECLTAMI